MKNKNTTFLLFFAISAVFCAPPTAFAKTMDKVLNCHFSSNKVLEVARSKDESTTYLYHIKKENTWQLLYQDEPQNESRGSQVKMLCAGEREKVFIIVGVFLSNYEQAVIIRHNKKNNKWERIDLAERSRPTHNYLSDREMLVVTPNSGYESEKAFFIEKFDSNKNRQLQRMASDQLPNRVGLSKIVVNLETD